MYLRRNRFATKAAPLREFFRMQARLLAAEDRLARLMRQRAEGKVTSAELEAAHRMVLTRRAATEAIFARAQAEFGQQ